MKHELYAKKTEKLIASIAKAVQELYNKEHVFKSEQREHYLYSGICFIFKNFIATFFFIVVTALEVTEGILNNKEASRQSLCLIRDIVYDERDEELINEMKTQGFINKDNNDDQELNNLKKSLIQM